MNSGGSAGASGNIPPSPASSSGAVSRLVSSSSSSSATLSALQQTAEESHFTQLAEDLTFSHDAKLETQRDPSQQVSEDVKNLFQFIGCYKPREMEIGAILRPFIPDYIPAVGAVDEFIKVPRPDGMPDYLGLKVLDESGSVQSDPAVVALQLRASCMQSSHHLAEVATVEDPEKNPRKIDAWIESMRDFHRSKAPSSVSYSKPMPDMEKLVAECPLQIEKALAEMQLMFTQEDVDLPTFVDICCSLVGIPVYKSRVESLHCLFALFLELKNSTHL